MLRRLFMLSLGLSLGLASPAWANLPEATTVPAYAVAKVLLKRGEVIMPEHVTPGTAPLNHRTTSALPTVDEVIGQEVVNAIRPGAPIVAAAIRTPPATYKGRTVSIRLRRPGLEINATGRALQDGYAGDNIRVLNQLNNKIVTATVIADGVVAVQ